MSEFAGLNTVANAIISLAQQQALIAKQQGRIAAAMERANALKEKELDLLQ